MAEPVSIPAGRRIQFNVPDGVSVSVMVLPSQPVSYSDTETGSALGTLSVGQSLVLPGDYWFFSPTGGALSVSRTSTSAQPAGSSAAAAVTQSGLVPVAGRVMSPADSSTQTDGVLTERTYRTPHTVHTRASALRLLWENVGTDPITVRASVEHPVSATIVQCTFNGAIEAVMQPNTRLMSDPVGVEVHPRQILNVRTRFLVTAGGKWWLGGGYVNGGGNGYGYNDGDATLSGTITTQAGQSLVAPSAVLGVSDKTPRSILIVGDSIAAGRWPITAFDARVQTSGIWGGLQTAGVIVEAKSSENAYDAAQGTARRQQYLRAAPYVLNAFEGYGTNDIRSALMLGLKTIDDRLGLWRALAGEGLRVFAGTVMPRSSSTDSYATTGNQTAIAGESERVIHNTWLRDGCPLIGGNPAPAGTTDPDAIRCRVYDATGNPVIATGDSTHPVYGVVELADAVESARNSGVWNAPNYTTDGTHPKSGATSPGNLAAAAAFPLSALRGDAPATVSAKFIDTFDSGAGSPGSVVGRVQTGGKWEERASYTSGDIRLTAAGRLRAAVQANDNIVLAPVQPDSADVWVQGVFNQQTTTAANWAGLVARVANFSSDDWYGVRVFPGKIDLVKRLAGVDTVLQSFVRTMSADETVRLTVKGTTLTVTLNGTQILQQTDTAITLPGRVGVMANVPGASPTDTTGIHIASFQSGDA